MYAVRATLHNASHTLNTCAHRAVLAHLGQPEVQQLRLAVKQHDVVGLEVAVSVPAKLLRFLCAGREVHVRLGRLGVRAFGVHEKQRAADALDDVQLLLIVERSDGLQVVRVRGSCCAQFCANAQENAAVPWSETGPGARTRSSKEASLLRRRRRQMFEQCWGGLVRTRETPQTETRPAPAIQQCLAQHRDSWDSSSF